MIGVLPQVDSARRAGFTLVEMIIASVLFATLAIVSVRMLTLLLKLDQTALVESHSMLVLERLGLRLREDVHRATAVEFEMPIAGVDQHFSVVKLRVGDQTVRYASVEAGLERTIAGRNALRPVARDLFALPAQQVEFVDDGSLLRLEISRTAPVSGRSTVAPSVVIEAAVQRGRRP